MEQLNSFINLVEGFSNQLKTKERVEHIFAPLNGRVVVPLSKFITHRLWVPLSDRIVSMGLTCAEKVCGAGIREKAADPLSTRNLIYFGGSLKTLSLWWARRRSVPIPGLSYFDTCSIVAARYITVFAKDAVQILELPKTARGFVEDFFNKEQNANDDPGRHIDYARRRINEFCGKESPQQPQESGGTLTWFASGILNAGKAFVSATQKVAPEAYANAEEKIKKLIDKKEEEIRKKLVQKGAQKLRFEFFYLATKWTLRAAISYGGYKLIEKGIVYLLPESYHHHSNATLTHCHNFISTCAKAVSIGLWIYALRPSLNVLYSQHKNGFDAEASILDSYKKKINKATWADAGDEVKRYLSEGYGKKFTSYVLGRLGMPK